MTAEKLLQQREYRARIGNATTKKYEKTKNGFLVRMYRNMQSRVVGIQMAKHHLYDGVQLWDREVFYSWAKSSKSFHELFDKWQSSGYERRLTPSVDRINSNLGYFVGNVEWVTHGENSRRGALSPKRKRNDC